MESSYFVDPYFLESRGEVTEANALEYFKTHPAYDANCLNAQLDDLRPAALARSNRTGVFYEARRAGRSSFVIRKCYFTGSQTLPVETFYVVDNRIFRAINFKALLQRRIANVAASCHWLFANTLAVPSNG